MTLPGGSGGTPRRAVVIGGGIGGMSCASLLAQEGLDTLLLESSAAIGGTARGFSTRGVHVELGCNVLGPAGEGKLLFRFLDYFADSSEISVSNLDPAACVKVHGDGEVLDLPAGVEAYVEAVAAAHPADREEILGFGALVRRTMDALRPYNMDRYFDLSASAERDILLSRESLADRLQGISSSRAAKLLSLFWSFTGTPPPLSPLSLYIPVMGSFLDGPCFMSGKSLVKALEKKIRTAGGKIRTGSEVTKIRIKDSAATGVEIGGEELREADIVVSTLHPRRTVRLLEDRSRVKRIIGRLEDAGETHGAFVAWFTAAGDGRGAGPPAQWHHLAGGGAGVGPSTPSDRIEDFEISVFTPNPEPPGPRILRALTLLPAGAFDQWKGTKTRKRGEQYERTKLALAEKIRHRVESALPEFKGRLELLASVTPLTLADELGHGGGAFGIMRSARRRALATCTWTTPLKGLFLGGQSVLFPGIAGTMETSLFIGMSLFGERHMVGRLEGTS
ncbi:MAG: FAD-dependent oxidoreductase [Pseudomonadota bacterium]